MRSPLSLIDAALWRVMCRAHETQRAGGVLVDPFAPYLANRRGEELFDAEANDLDSFLYALGSATIDDMLRRAISDHHIHTVAGLAAGFDTRPYRLELPNDLRWIEADLEPVLGYEVLRLAHAAPHCQVRRVNVDLSSRLGRRRVLVEMATDVTRGLVLTEEAPTRLGLDVLRDLVEAMPHVFKYWILDTIETGPDPLASGGNRELCRQKPHVLPQDILDIFSRRQWRPREFSPLRDQAHRLDKGRATTLIVAHPPGELEGVWLLQRSP